MQPEGTGLRPPRRGDRIKLMATADPYTDLRPGALGTVDMVDGMGTVFVAWDSGSHLGLVPDEDRWEVLVPGRYDTAIHTVLAEMPGEDIEDHLDAVCGLVGLAEFRSNEAEITARLEALR